MHSIVRFVSAMSAPLPECADPCFDLETGKHIEVSGFGSDMWAVFFTVSFAYFVPGVLICVFAHRLSKDPA